MQQLPEKSFQTCEHFPANSPEEELFSWLICAGMGNYTPDNLLREFCERLGEVGVNLHRGNIAVTTIHPQVSAFMYTWRHQKGLITNTRHLHSDEPGEGWFSSPFFHMIGNQVDFMHRHLEGNNNLDFPVLEEFRQEGLTDWFSQLFDFGWGNSMGEWDDPSGMITSWASAHPGGFTKRDFDILRRAIPLFALAVKAVASFQVAETVLETYIGKTTAREVLAGQIQRGTSKTISSVLLFADLRGFTRLADNVGGEDLVGILDQYLERMADPVAQFGGEVLKFIGDGMLATFPLEPGQEAEICRNSLMATQSIMTLIKNLNQRRRAEGAPVMELDVALHIGNVMYGNVGSESRLDFTVVGSAVNEVSRMESKCGELETSIILSDEFVSEALYCRDQFISVGEHRLRGVRTPKKLYSLKEGSVYLERLAG